MWDVGRVAMRGIAPERLKVLLLQAIQRLVDVAMRGIALERVGTNLFVEVAY